METINPRSPGRLFNLTAWMPLLWLSLAFLAGILFAGKVTLSVLVWLILAGGSLVIFILFRILHARFHISITPLLLFSPALLGVFFLGAARYQATIPRVDANYIAWYNDRDYQLLVTGTLTDPPDVRDTYTNLRVNVTSLDAGDQSLPVHGLILARVPPGTDWHYGDVVRLRGHLQTPPENEDFSYQDYLARQGILSYMPDAAATLLPFNAGNPVLRLVYAFKDQAIAHVYRIFPEPEASLLAGILLGDDNGLSASLQQAYKNTGTAHIIAISGFNIAIIAGVFVFLFSRLLGRRRGAIAAVIGIILYTVLVGATASVVRAAIMGGLAILAGQLGRRQNGLNTLATTAAVMAVINPNTLWDVGFQLSFAATLGLILYAQPLQDWFTRLLARRLPLRTAQNISAPLSSAMFFTLAAQLTTLPIMAYQFGRVSLVSIIANPFVLPVQPAVMVLAGLAVLLSFIYIPLGQVVAWVAWPFAAYTDRAVEFFNGFPHGVVILGDFSFLFVVLFFGILLLLTFGGRRVKEAIRPILAPSVIIAALGVIVFLVWSAFFQAPDGRLRLTFLNVGSADAILIQTPSGRSILVDGGPSPSMLAGSLGPRLSAFDRSIDWLVVASTQDQQVAALPTILDRFPVRNVLWSGNLDASYSAENLDRWLAGSDIPVTPAYPGAELDLGDGARLKVQSVSPRGSVLLVEWQGFRALLPVGINFDTLSAMDSAKAIGPVTALLLADSGYAPSNPPEWIGGLHPQLAILSVAAGDPDGLPAQSVIDSLSGVTLLRTDRNGWISLSTDGVGLWVDAEKK
ncbi:MAG: ComEC/Rec2 family competence protein [Anaerolineales bacterium]